MEFADMAPAGSERRALCCLARNKMLIATEW
jgi:hypothetical protein